MGLRVSSKEVVYKATWKRDFELPWREAGPPKHLDDKVDSDQQVVNTELPLFRVSRSVFKVSWFGLVLAFRGSGLNRQGSVRGASRQRCGVSWSA